MKRFNWRRLLYSVSLYLATPLAFAYLLYRAIRQRDYLRHWPERLGYRLPRASRPVIWLHAVSVGETRAAAPLVARLQQAYPQYQLLLTHMTPTGRATGEALYGDRVLRCYLPYDHPDAVRRFLRHFQPVTGILMETELWFNLIDACERKDIPLLLANARLSAKSADKYARAHGLIRQALGQLTGIAAQTEADAARFRQLGAQTVSVLGNIKFDIAPPATAGTHAAALRGLFGRERPVFLAASTRDGEEAPLLHAWIQQAAPHELLVMVPRHPQRFDEVAQLLEQQQVPYQRRSENRPVDAATRVVLGDSMGEMFAYYGAADVAFIGGSLLPFGGQNLIEACAMGTPVLLGEHTYNFKEASELAVAAGAALRCATAEAITQAAIELLQAPAQRRQMAAAGQAFYQQHQGAADRTLAWLAPWLQPAAH